MRFLLIYWLVMDNESFFRQTNFIFLFAFSLLLLLFCTSLSVCMCLLSMDDFHGCDIPDRDNWMKNLWDYLYCCLPVRTKTFGKRDFCIFDACDFVIVYVHFSMPLSLPKNIAVVAVFRIAATIDLSIWAIYPYTTKLNECHHQQKQLLSILSALFSHFSTILFILPNTDRNNRTKNFPRDQSGKRMTNFSHNVNCNCKLDADVFVYCLGESNGKQTKT